MPQTPTPNPTPSRSPASQTQTIRLVCLTTTLPDAPKQGRIPPREAKTVARYPTGAEGFTLQQLRKPPRFTQIILAEDCTCEGLDTARPLPDPDTIRAGRATQSAGQLCNPQAKNAPESPGFSTTSAERALTHTASLTDRNYGTWHGQTLRDLPPDALNAMLHDPDFAPPEGESLNQFHARIGAWLTTASQGEMAEVEPDAANLLNGSSSGTGPAASSGKPSRTRSDTSALTVLLIARPAVVRALATHILQGGVDMANRLDIAPQTTSLFTHHAGNWRVRMLGVP
ncbi:histidine phosphatase family protein [Acetobacter malorum]|uniref:histidine phosphatase family protein n=1 Tax=Acetobacter malorum TaxID=178901 RepID=UPI0039ECFB5B